MILSLNFGNKRYITKFEIEINRDFSSNEYQKFEKFLYSPFDHENNNFLELDEVEVGWL